MTEIFVTGATGQVGSYLVNYLVKEKPLGISKPEEIICLVRTPKKAGHLKKLGVTIANGSLTDKYILKRIFHESNIRYVFHVAANCAVTGSYRDFYVPNVIGTKNLLEAFADSKAECFVYTSSIAVYDSFLNDKQNTIITEKSPIGPFRGEAYSVTKRKAESLVFRYQKHYPEKSLIITRLGPVVGAGDFQMLPALIKLLTMRFTPKLISNGRDFFSITPPKDIARAQVFLAERKDMLKGEAFNVAGENITYRQIYNIICDFYGLKKPVISIPMWLFKMVRPTLPYIKRIFPNNNFIQTAFSQSALGYLGKSFFYKNDKIEKLGFKFKVSALKTITEGLIELSKTKEFAIRETKIKPYVVASGEEALSAGIKDLEESFIELGPHAKDKSLKSKKKHIKRLLIFLGIIALIIIYLLFHFT